MTSSIQCVYHYVNIISSCGNSYNNGSTKFEEKIIKNTESNITLDKTDDVNN